jgi:hypothetical protein
MQQLQSIATTAEQSEKTAQTFSVVSPDIVTPSEAAETNVVQQEQADAVAKLLAALERDTQKRQKWNKRLDKISGLLLISLMVVTIGPSILTRHIGKAISVFVFANYINLLGFVLCKIFLEIFLDKKAALEVTKVEDVRCVNALVDVWGAQVNINYTKRVRAQARTALTRLLPRLEAGDAPLLKETQRAVLRGVLTSTGNANSVKDADVDFTLAILKAFENVGDWKSAPYVKRLTGSVTPKRIRDAASECLPYLQALAAKQKPGETLLRASSANEAANVSPETLLRPAAPQQETDPDTLLRPSEELSC